MILQSLLFVVASETLLATMSSQENAGIPLLHMPSGVGYKLLELPQELVSFLENEDSPP